MTTSTAPAGSVRGQCLCGAVSFVVQLPFKWVAHCHCSMCRKAHGAPYVTWAGAREDGVVVDGAAHVVRFASSVDASREHCGVCGSPLFFRSARWGGEVHIARALLPDDIGKAPQSHVFFSDRAPWVHVDDGLPKKGGASGTAPLS